MPKIIWSVQEHERTVKELEDNSYHKIKGHMVFDIMLGENFRQKARFVANSHKTETSTAITYSTVVSEDSVCIGLTITTLNNLEVL